MIGKPDDEERHEPEAEDREVRAHHVGGVLRPAEAGLHQREPGLHEDHQHRAEDHPQQVEAPCHLADALAAVAPFGSKVVDGSTPAHAVLDHEHQHRQGHHRHGDQLALRHSHDSS